MIKRKGMTTVMCSLLTAATLLAGCGQSAPKNEPAAQESEAKQEETKETEKAESEAAEIEAVLESEEQEAIESVVAESEGVSEAESEEEYEFGTNSEYIYENETFGFGVDLVYEGFYFLDREEIAMIMNLAGDMITDEAVKESFDKTGSATDFYVASDYGATINMQVQDSGIVFGTLVSEEDYLKLSLEAADLENALSMMGVKDVTITQGTGTLLGQEHPAAEIHGVLTEDGEDIDMYEKMIVLKKGKYFGLITVCTYVENDCDLIFEEFFYSLD